MTILLALAVAVLFGVGVFLMLKNDVIRVVSGVITISNAANLLIISSGLQRGVAPIFPLDENPVVSDPLVQAMVLTAIVISFGATALLLCLVYRVYIVQQQIEHSGRPEAGLIQQQLAASDTELEREEELV